MKMDKWNKLLEAYFANVSEEHLKQAWKDTEVYETTTNMDADELIQSALAHFESENPITFTVDERNGKFDNRYTAVPHNEEAA